MESRSPIDIATLVSLEKVACGAFSDRATYPPAKGVALAGCRVAAGKSDSRQTLPPGGGRHGGIGLMSTIGATRHQD
jgi:hypothetical protein